MVWVRTSTLCRMADWSDHNFYDSEGHDLLFFKLLQRLVGAEVGFGGYGKYK